MPNLRKLASSFGSVKRTQKAINWFPGHMYGGMQAMLGKLNTVDCVIEVHDARIPTIGRNKEFRNHLGAIKPHILVLNKSDLADLSNWTELEARLAAKGDKNILLTDLSGSEFGLENRGYTKLMDMAFRIMRESDRNNRAHLQSYKVMIVGIPNVGKSTLINRLRQHHLGSSGEATRTGNLAGVTRHVENVVKICAKPLIYSLDTPGVLQPTATKNFESAMKLALCSTISDKAVNPRQVAEFLLNHLNKELNDQYAHSFELSHPEPTLDEFCRAVAIKHYPKYQHMDMKTQNPTNVVDHELICWKLVRLFRRGVFGKVMFE